MKHAKKQKITGRARRARRVRKKVYGTAEQPRLSVHRSLKSIYAQLIDDDKGVSILGITSRNSQITGQKIKDGNIAVARAVGLLVAQKAKAFGMNSISFDPFVGEDAMSKNNVEKVEMEALLKRSDFISLHAPLTDETENAINLDKFSSMKKTAWIINTSRGPIIRENDLAMALDQGLIAGAALDVLATEPPDKDSPLLSRDNVFITPHIAWMSLGARDDMQRKGVEEVVRVLKGERPKNVVNSEVL